MSIFARKSLCTALLNNSECRPQHQPLTQRPRYCKQHHMRENMLSQMHAKSSDSEPSSVGQYVRWHVRSQESCTESGVEAQSLRPSMSHPPRFVRSSKRVPTAKSRACTALSFCDAALSSSDGMRRSCLSLRMFFSLLSLRNPVLLLLPCFPRPSIPSNPGELRVSSWQSSVEIDRGLDRVRSARVEGLRS